MKKQLVVLLFAVLVGLHSRPVAAQSSDVDFLLAYSEAEGVLAGFRPAFNQHLAQLGVRPTAELNAALDEVLTVEALLPIMREAFAAQGEPAAFAAAAELVRGGAIGRVHAQVDTIELTVPLAEYAATVDASPPPQERLELIGSITQSQAAGEFYLLMSETQREASTMVASAMSVDVSEFVPLPEDQQAELNQQYLIGAFYSFLQRYESVSDAELNQVLAEWQSDTGRWFVRAYSYAVAEVAYEAADRIVQRISGSS